MDKNEFFAAPSREIGKINNKSTNDKKDWRDYVVMALLFIFVVLLGAAVGQGIPTVMFWAIKDKYTVAIFSGVLFAGYLVALHYTFKAIQIWGAYVLARESVKQTLEKYRYQRARQIEAFVNMLPEHAFDNKWRMKELVRDYWQYVDRFTGEAAQKRLKLRKPLKQDVCNEDIQNFINDSCNAVDAKIAAAVPGYLALLNEQEPKRAKAGG